jgi:hypothetical protein
LKKEKLTKYKILQLEAETKQQTDAYLTQEETAKEIVRRMVANIDTDYIEELNNKYTVYNNKTPKSLLAHIYGSYCKTTVTDQLKADRNFAKPWDQVMNLGTWITQLEQLHQKCEEVRVAIDDGHMADTLLLDHPTQLENLNKLYEVQTTQKSQSHIRALLARTDKQEYVHNVYKLPCIKQTVRYLHTAAGHPTEDTWLKAIRKGNYNSWPLIDTKKVRQYFPESEETQFGHMRGQCQGVQSTRTTHPTVADTPNKLLEKKNDIFIHIYDLNEND